jgi:predicted transposase YbfD/YdcC
MAAHRVSAWVREHHLVRGQVKREEPSNDIRAIPELVASLEIGGDTRSIDAMGWKTAIGSTIREGGGTSVLWITEKQKVGYEEITE